MQLTPIQIHHPARVLEKAGDRLEGRLVAQYFRDDEYIDRLLYAKLRLPG